jgi:hypothetical protein
MDPSAVQGYIQLIEIILSAGIQTEASLRTLLSSHVSPADLDVILGEVTTRLARRGVADSTGTP